MKLLNYILIPVLLLISCRLGAQCVIVGSTQTICQGGITAGLGGSLSGVGGDATSAVWSDGGVGGLFSDPNALNATWTPPASYTGTATLKLTALNGTTCSGSSATVQITVNSSPAASVSIIATGNPACPGASISFLASPVNGGSPTYDWKINGISNGSSSNPFVSSSLANGDVVSVAMTSSLTCKTGSPATSNTITVGLLPLNTINLSSGVSTTSQTVCKNSAIAPITYNTTGASGASFSGLPAGATGLWASNVVTISGSPSGTGLFNYTVTLTGGCGSIQAIGSITVTPLPVATFSYAGTPYCKNESNPSPTFSGGGVAGTFSSTSGLVFVNASTGQVDLAASTAGTYTITNTIAAAGGCGSVQATSPITITALPEATISYSGSPWCGSAGVQSVTLVGPGGGTYSSTPGLSLNTVTGAITTSTSTPGNYTVNYYIPATGGCLSYPTSTPVTISQTPTAPDIGLITQPGCAPSTGSVILNGLPTGNWTVTRTPGGVITSGSTTSTLITNLPSGTYTFTVTNAAGCVSPSSASVIINAAFVPPAVPVQSPPDCALGFDHATVTVASPTGAGLEYRLTGSLVTIPYQTSNVFSNVKNDSYYITVKNSSGCESSGVPFSVSCGCVNGPTVVLSSLSGSTCGTTPVSLTGNTFGGSATSVTLTHNGSGTLIPSAATTSPFSFVYTPALADGDKTITIIAATNNPLGSPCAPGVANYTLKVHAIPVAPVIGAITPPTCSSGTGSVNLSGLPSSGTWTLTRSPGAVITTGSGTTTTIAGLVPGTYSFIVASADGCISVSSGSVVIPAPPSAPTAPVIGAITQPTCASSTGSVALSGLPSTGNWTLTRSPGGVTISGTGAAYTVPALPAGNTYTFTVTNSTGCISPPSGNVVINSQPPIPPAPAIGTITVPTCSITTGSVVLTGLPASGNWTLTRLPGTITTAGTGTSTTITGLLSGQYNFTVTTADGCLSVASGNVVVPAPPAIPAAPVIGTITQPTFSVPSGSVVLTGLPSGSWVITRLPGSVTTSGTGTSKTISNLVGGVYTFTVTNSSGCTSTESNSVTISTPGSPSVMITDPAVVCSPATVNLTSEAITAGSTAGLIYTYWEDAGASITYATPEAATNGTYYIKGTTVSGYFSIKPVTVKIDQLPVPNAGPDQTLYYQFNTTLAASLAAGETGLWSFYTGSGSLADATKPNTEVTDLSKGNNQLLWTVKTEVCPAVSDTVDIIVKDLIIPTLITPNMDGRNDYFVLKGLSQLGKTELVIFDRRGAEVFRNIDYDNLWDGVDYNKKPLPDDTYFYVIKSENAKSISGYVVIRR